MANYTRLAATAKRLVDKNGRSVTLTKQGKTPVDPLKPWRGVDTPALESVSGKGAFVLPSKKSNNEENIKRADATVYFAANSAGGKLLETYDTVLDNGTVWKIVSAEVINPGSKRLLYIFGVAR